MSSPQEVNTSGDVIGHSHLVIEALSGFGQTTPTDPKNFVFFKALNDRAVDGVLSTVITGGLSAGYYRISTIHTAANHQPSTSNRGHVPEQRRVLLVLIAALESVVGLPVAQRGAMGDMVYVSIHRSVNPVSTPLRQSDIISSQFSVA